jgi:hypothetical protein
MAGTRNILGLAVDDCGVVAAELHVRQGRPEVRCAGEFSWGQPFTPDNAREMGLKLRQFLREHGFSVRRAVVGLPAKWVLAKEMVVPPAGPDALAGVLSIQAERAFSLNSAEMVFDYCGRTSASEKSCVLLLAAQRRMIGQLRELTDTAGLHVQAMTVTALACSRVPSDIGPANVPGTGGELSRLDAGSAHRCGLHIRPTYCEFWSQSDDMPRAIRHIPMAGNGVLDDRAVQLCSAIGRLILLSPGHDPARPHQVTAYDACGLSDAAMEQINERLGPHVVIHDGRMGLASRGLALEDAPGTASPIAAVAVGMTALETGGPAVDFLNPRIGHRKISDRRRIVVWAASVALACIVVLSALVADWYGDTRDIAAFSEQLEQMGDDIAAARAVVERVSYAGSWTSREPRFLNCLRELTLAFPDEPSVWVTSLAVNENGVGSLVGKAASDTSFNEVFRKIEQNPAFSNVQWVHLRNAGRDSREKEFAISFTFEGVK